MDSVTTGALIRMYDSVNAEEVPAGADLYAGYINGQWPSYGAFKARFPQAAIISISVDAFHDADVLDIENGDATPQQGPSWVQRQRARGHNWPTIYTSESNWPACQQAFVDAGVSEPFWWIAAVPGPGPVLFPGSIAHQWRNVAEGGLNYDESVVDPTWPPRRGATPNPYPPVSGSHGPHPPKPGPRDIDAVLGLGASGRDVVLLQRSLDNRGIRCIPDGRYGRFTKLAVEEFQRRAGLLVDGLCGPQTWRALGF